jgi:hypothetical protein
MGDAIASDERWILRSATTADIDALMVWFPSKGDVEIWGGPTFPSRRCVVKA